jgi:hypothetical protein
VKLTFNLKDKHMKRIGLFLIALIISVGFTQSQSTINQKALSKSLKIDSIYSNFEKLKQSFEYKTRYLFELDVAKYYDITGSDLELAVFKKSKEYTEKLNELKSMKTEFSKKVFYWEENFSFIRSNYDLKKKGFSVQFGTDLADDYNGGTGFPPMTIAGRVCPAIPCTKIAFKPTFFDYYYFLPTNEENGLKIEKNNVTVLYLFSINNTKVVKFKKGGKLGTYGEDYLVEATDAVFIPKFLRLILFNTESKEIYFDKIYLPNK